MFGVQGLVYFGIGTVGLLDLPLLIDEGVRELLVVELVASAVAEDLRVLVDHILEATSVCLLLYGRVEGELSVISIVISLRFAFEIVRVEIIAVVVGVAEFHLLELGGEVVCACAIQRTVVSIVAAWRLSSLRLARRGGEEALDALLIRMEATLAQHLLRRRHHLSTHLVSLGLWIVRVQPADSCRLRKVEVY